MINVYLKKLYTTQRMLYVSVVPDYSWPILDFILSGEMRSDCPYTCSLCIVFRLYYQ